MAHKISLTLLKHCNGRSLRSTTFNDIQLLVSSKAAGESETRKLRQIGTGSFWKMTTNKMLTSEPTVEICVAQDHDHDRLLEFLRIHYYEEEPLTVGSEPKEQEKADEEFNMSNIKYGTCLMAMQRNGDKEHIIGAAIAGPKDCHEMDNLDEEAAMFGSTSKWGRILKILARIERDSNVFKRFGIERALHVHALGVDRCARGLAVGARLIKELMALGQKRNFQLLTIDCTSFYSARLCERLGMQCVNILRYEDYCDEHGNQVFRPPPPHDAILTYAISLSD